MLDVLQSATFQKWFKSLKDAQSRARIDARIRRLSLGNPGDAKALREGVSELRVDSGPGYRVYFTKRGALVVLLLCGGDKGTQDKDIEPAINIAKEWTLWR